MEGWIWVFNGSGAQFPSGVFSSREAASNWISKHRLTGVLTCYPIDEGVYDWATRTGLFEPKRDKHHSPEFIGAFSSAMQQHVHFENGLAGS